MVSLISYTHSMRDLSVTAVIQVWATQALAD